MTAEASAQVMREFVLRELLSGVQLRISLARIEEANITRALAREREVEDMTEEQTKAETQQPPKDTARVDMGWYAKKPSEPEQPGERANRIETATPSTREPEIIEMPPEQQKELAVRAELQHRTEFAGHAANGIMQGAGYVVIGLLDLHTMSCATNLDRGAAVAVLEEMLARVKGEKKVERSRIVMP